MDKPCKECGKVKEIAEFYKSETCIGGYKVICKVCCRVKNNKYKREQYKNNKQKFIDSVKKYYLENREKKREYNREYGIRNRQKISVQKKEYSKNNRERINNYTREYYKKRMRIDAGYKVKNNIRRAILRCLRKEKNHSKWMDILGYNTKQLMDHLQGDFKDGMSWDNYGEWHIDHIKPLVSFRIKGKRDPKLKEAWALGNLQPLWAEENLIKGSKY